MAFGSRRARSTSATATRRSGTRGTSAERRSRPRRAGSGTWRRPSSAGSARGTGGPRTGVDHYIANSEITRQRIEQFYGRDSTVVHPPVDVDRFAQAEPEDWFLIVGAVMRHKRVDLALEAARLAGVRVKVVGEGPEIARLEAEYASCAEFLGRVDEAELLRLLPRARALIVPGVEEFGIAAVEAQAAGRPVVGRRAGGVAETVIDGETGVLVDDPDPRVFAEVLSEVDFTAFSPERAVQRAAEFSPQRFRTRLSEEVSRLAGSSRQVVEAAA